MDLGSEGRGGDQHLLISSTSEHNVQSTTKNL
ncbi:hypothetical protein AHF37_10601 [Paragonimus kellicotti]|nr:hypothetical protein AHF37_10601 [Paragonimus kellicotti]